MKRLFCRIAGHRWAWAVPDPGRICLRCGETRPEWS